MPGAKRPDPNEMTDFNVLTHERQGVSRARRRLVCEHRRAVRIRFGNLSAMDHHPIHLHGYYWKVVATDGGPLPVVRAMAGDHGAGAHGQHPRTSSSSPTHPETGRCTAT